MLNCTAVFALCSHHPWLSPPINPDSYSSVIIDLKTAQTLTVIADTRTHTHIDRHAQTTHLPCPEKSFYACAIVQVKLHSTFYDCRDKYHTGMQRVSGQFRLIFIKSVPPPALNGLVQVVTWEPATGYPTKVFHFRCHHWFKVEPHKNCILIMSSNRVTSFYWTTFTGKFDFLKLMKDLKYIHLKSVQIDKPSHLIFVHACLYQCASIYTYPANKQNPVASKSSVSSRRFIWRIKRVCMCSCGSSMCTGPRMYSGHWVTLSCRLVAAGR